MTTSVKDIMKKPIMISNDVTIHDAIQELIKNKISRLLISEGKKCSTIVTEKDIGLFLLNDNSKRNLKQIPLSEIMRPLKSVSPSTSIKESAKTMMANSISSLAVNSDDTTIGVLTKTDLTKHYIENFSGKKTIGEYAALYYVWSYSDDTIYSVVSKMIDEKISRIILRNRDETPIGILTFRDLFEIALRQGNQEDVLDNSDPAISVVFSRKGFLSETGFGATKAGEIMTRKIISVNYDDDLALACQTMLDKKINAVAVIANSGRIVGILSKTDVIRVLAILD